MSTRTILRHTFAFLGALLLSASVNAQLFRAYLAADGNDANPCTLAAPCRLLPAALAAVANGGQIWMLDSANYNTATVTIGKSVSILAIPGTVGSVVAVGGPAISITAASLTVALRNLVIVPLPGGGGTHGVQLTGASALTIEHSLIANLPGEGVFVVGTGSVKIADTVFRKNDGGAVVLENGAAGVISRTQMLANAAGVAVHGNTATTTTASVSDSLVSGGTVGVNAFANGAGAVVQAFVTRSTIEGTTAGGLRSLTSGVGSTLVTVSYSMVTNNGNGWYQSGVGSVIKTLGNNHIEDNANTVGSLTPTALQ
jgi:hypothetical protein